MGQGTIENKSLSPPPVSQLLSPADLPADADGKLPFWRPDFLHVARSLGWQWLRICGLMIGIFFILLGTLASGGFWSRVGSLWMWISIAIAVTTAIADTLWQAAQKRKDPYCIHCGYSLEGLPQEHVCPECGRQYNFELIKLYQQDPKSFVQRWKAERAKKS